MAQKPAPVPAHPHQVGQHDQDFNEILVEQLKRAPWFVCSLVFHALLFLIIGTLTVQTRSLEDKKEIQAEVKEKELETFEEVQPEVEEEEIEEQETEDPVLEEITEVTDLVDDTAVTDENMSDVPFDGKSINNVLGLGGGAGGAFGGRRGGHKGGSGGSKAQRAVEWGLQWLANHQSADGSWDSDGFQAQCKTNICEGKGHPLYDAGLTGLALLAFLGAGYTHNFGKYKDNVRNGLRYLTTIQDPEGCFGNRTAHNFTYSHAICTLAMTEAYGLTQFALFKGPAQKGLDFVSRCRNPYAAWRYGIQPGDNDSSVTGWMVMAIKSGEAAGLQINPDDFKGTRDFLDSVTDELGKVGYTQRGNGPVRLEGKQEEFPDQFSEALTAVGVLSRVFMKEDPAKSEKIKNGADLMLTKLPTWEPPKLDFYYWYYGTLAMYQVGGKHFDQWNKAMQDAVIKTQESEGDEKGSWAPKDAWGEEGGRIYSTALLTMCLEVYYRYGKVFGAGR